MKPKALDYDDELIEELRRVYGSAVAAFLESLLRPPERYYLRVNSLRASVDKVEKTIAELGYRVFRDEVLEEALWLPVEGPARIESDADCVIVVDKRAAESVMLGANVYGPGVVRVTGRCVKGGLAVVMPEHMLFPVALAEFVSIEAYEKGRGLVARTVKPLYRLPSFRDTELYARGLVYEQSLPSMLVGRVAVEAAGKPRLIVDMCAAPGGKTSHVVELTRGEARVLAFDHSARKLARMREELERLGHLARVELRRADSRYLDIDYPQLVGKVDLVILDPPCTAIGVVPKVWDRKGFRDVVNASDYQRQFLKVAAKLLKPCGVLVYSTCTVTLRENEENIDYAERELGLAVEDVYPRHPRSGKAIGFRQAVRFHPHVHGLPGYFIAVLRKPC